MFTKKVLPSLYFTVTNDLNFDQRMIRICTSLAENGYDVTLVGRKKKGSPHIISRPFRQKRISCFFEKGKLFYAEYNTRLFFFLLFRKMDAICAIDLDTILPVYQISRLKKIPRVYDAHELFCEMQEVVTRPVIYKAWKRIERRTVPYFKHGYTVNEIIANEFNKMYGVSYEVIRSFATYKPHEEINREKILIYQGAVNEGRSFETLIPAMKLVNAPLYIYGDGNFLTQARQLVNDNHLENKVIFKGMIQPEELRHATKGAYIGVTLFSREGKSNYYSLANRFFDYIHAATPQICVDYPVYKELNDEYNIAVLVNDLTPSGLAQSIGLLLEDKALWDRLHQNCIAAAKVLNWQHEEIKLLAFYKRILG